MNVQPQVKPLGQQTILAPDSLEIVFKITVESGGNIVHAGLKWKDAGTGTMLGVHCSPRMHPDTMHEQIDEFAAEIRRLVDNAVHPFGSL